MGLVELKEQRGASKSPTPAAASFDQIAQPGVAESFPAPPSPLLTDTPAVVVPIIPDESPDFFSPVAEPLQSDRIEATSPPAPDFEFEMVEGSADDDLWGAFELEDVSEADEEDSRSAFERGAAGAEEVTEPFGFPEEEGGAFPEQGGPDGVAPAWEPVEESGFTFGEEAEPSPFEIAPDDQFGSFEEEPAHGFETGPVETGDFLPDTTEGESAGLIDIKPYAPPAEQEFELLFAPEEEELASPASTATIQAGQEFELQFAPGEEYVPAPEALAPPASTATPQAGQEFDLQFAPDEEYMPAPESLTPPPAPSAPPPAPAVAAESALSDDQLAALVSKGFPRDIIEKIAWEVVPDLAERIIYEEIRKIKEGA